MPTDFSPVPQDNGIARIRPAMVGDIQAASEGEINSAATSEMTPRITWSRWRRMIDLNGTEPSSRRCGSHPVSKPNRMCSTWPEWIIIMIGASRADISTSNRVESTSRIAPPAPRRVGPSNRATIRPKSFGASSTAMVRMNSASDRSASNTGQVGYKVNSREKYSGRIYFACRTSRMPTSNWASQNGEAT